MKSFDELKRIIKTYDDVLKELGIQKQGRRIARLNIDDDSNERSYARYSVDKGLDRKVEAFIAIKNIEKLFCGDWVKDWTNNRQYKYYPYFEKASRGWRFFVSSYLVGGSYGEVAFYPSAEISDFVGKLFIEYYIILAE